MSLEMTRSYMGYCWNCEEPGKVGDIAVKGWPHVMAICPKCLSKLGDQIQKGQIYTANELLAK